jgi:hypothetical protein
MNFKKTFAILLKKQYITPVVRSFTIRGFICCNAKQKYLQAAFVETCPGVLGYVVQTTSLASENSGAS